MALFKPNTKSTVVLFPVSATAAYTPESTGIDTLGYSHLSMRFVLGAVGATMSVLKVVSGNTSAGTGTDVYVFGATGKIALPTTSEAKSSYEIYIPLNGNSKRYYNVAATAGGSATLLMAEGFLEGANVAPTTNALRGLTNSDSVTL